MTEKFDLSTRKLVAKDYKNIESAIKRLKINESLSVPFEIEAEIVCSDFNPEAQLGQEMTLTRYLTQGGKRQALRHFHGYITHIQFLGNADNNQLQEYRLQLRPWLWLLKHTCHSRVFQNKSSKEIVCDIFDEAGFKGKYKTASLPTTKREYCIQYNETDFDFIERLLAEEGIHYYFEQSESGHTLLLHDASSPYQDADINEFDFINTPDGNLEILTQWVPEHNFHGKSLELNNYDYSQSKLVSSKKKTASHSLANNTKLINTRFAHSSVAGDFTDLAKNLVARRIALLEQDYHKITGASESQSLFVASNFSLKSHPDTAQIGKYALLSLEQEYVSDESHEANYSNCFTCIPATSNTFPLVKNKPNIQGLQSAVVAGSKEGEPNQDDESRIRIQFHWDTQTSGDKTSCWVRVAQTMAGNGFGLQAIPRAGQEVLVSFINGDPDLPVVTGAVYNSTHKPPYPEANTSKSGIKTQLKGQSNELRFDDKKDNEELFLHAAKDMNVEVENDETCTIKGQSQTKVTKQIAVTTEDSYQLSASKDIKGKGKTISLEADDKIELKVGSSKLTMTTSSITIESGDIQLKASKGLKLDGMTLEGKASTSAKLSGATLDLKASGNAKLSGAAVTVDAQTTLTAQGKLSADLKSDLKASINSSVMTEVKGTIVKVN